MDYHMRRTRMLNFFLLILPFPISSIANFFA